MKKVLTTVLSLALVACLSIAGTLAYLTSEDSDVNVMTLGNVQIEQHEYERVLNEDGTYKTDTINDQNSYVLDDFSQAKPLYPIVGDPNEPGDSPAYAGWDDTRVYMSQVNSYGNMQVFAGKNAQDKFVTVENTGLSDAYVRTLVAIEIGSTDGSKIKTSSRSGSDTAPWVANDVGTITVGGTKYMVLEFIYRGASDVNRHVNGVLPAGETTYPSLCQVYLKHNATNEDMEAIDGNNNGTLDVLVLSQAVQAAGFADAQTALDTAFGEVDADNATKWFNVNVESTDDDKELEDALQGNEGTIVVNLTGDVTYDTAAWQNEAMGGKETKEVVINGNGHTITFNNTNSDWNNIVTNGAKLVINNATITNAGHDATSGTWNGHDINFNCEIELNNVKLLNAISVSNGATLNNVTITDDSTGDAYMLWIRAVEQKVVLNGCVIDATGTAGDDRGIKIDEQYIDAPGKVTLEVKDTTFKTEKKAAILVKSVAGADITLENVDISGVAADTTNVVWVDADAATYADKVTVTGGAVIVENN